MKPSSIKDITSRREDLFRISIMYNKQTLEIFSIREDIEINIRSLMRATFKHINHYNVKNR